MSMEFWQQRWEQKQIGFHEGRVNRYLETFEQRMSGDRPSRVLVPLCGKTVDMVFLAGRGHSVTGIEGVDIAAREFFHDQGIETTVVETAASRRIEGAGVAIYVANFFDVAADSVGLFDCVYDRAALVAISDEHRQRYARQELSFLRSGGRLLLVTFDYDRTVYSGPPFAVPQDEVRELYAHDATIELLEETDILDREPRFKARGMTWLKEAAWLITKI